MFFDVLHINHLLCHHLKRAKALLNHSRA